MAIYQPLRIGGQIIKFDFKEDNNTNCAMNKWKENLTAHFLEPSYD